MRLDKKQKRGLFRGAIITIITMILITVFGYVLCMRVPESYYNIQGLYQAEKIDVLFVGNSHGIASFHTQVFSDETGLNAYNVSTTNQTVMSGTLLVEEALNLYDLDTVVIETFSMIYPQPSDFYYSKMLVSDTAVFRSLKNPKLKIKGVLSQLGMRRKFDAMLPLFQNHANWKTPKEWQLRFYPFPLQQEERDEYEAKHINGYRIIPWVMSQKQYDAYLDYKYSFNLDIMNSSQSQWDEIIRLCHEKDVNVVFVTAPWLDRFIANTNYTEISDAYDDYFESRDVTYIDMNEIDLGLTFENYSSEDPSMNQHLNETGAKIMTRYLSKWYQAYIEIENR